MKKIFYIILYALTLVSCEKEIEIDIEETDQKMVVNALFNTDSTWLVELSKSKYIYDTVSIEKVLDAQVSIEDTEGNLTNLLHEGDGLYGSNVDKPKIGESYTLEVLHDQLGYIKAQTKAPGAISFMEVSVGDDILLSGESMKEILVSFKDDLGSDRYMVQLQSLIWIYEDFDPITSKPTDSVLYTIPVSIQVNDGGAGVFGSKGFGNTVITFSDELFDGNAYTLNLMVDGYYFSSKDISTFAMVVSLSKISQEYFWYENSYQQYLSSQGNPFAQPVQVYTNVENGLGVFAGYATTIDTLHL